jgi:hypothetical protein
VSDKKKTSTAKERRDRQTIVDDSHRRGLLALLALLFLMLALLQPLAARLCDGLLSVDRVRTTMVSECESERRDIKRWIKEEEEDQ